MINQKNSEPIMCWNGSFYRYTRKNEKIIKDFDISIYKKDIPFFMIMKKVKYTEIILDMIESEYRLTKETVNKIKDFIIANENFVSPYYKIRLSGKIDIQPYYIYETMVNVGILNDKTDIFVEYLSNILNDRNNLIYTDYLAKAREDLEKRKKFYNPINYFICPKCRGYMQYLDNWVEIKCGKCDLIITDKNYENIIDQTD